MFKKKFKILLSFILLALVSVKTAIVSHILDFDAPLKNIKHVPTCDTDWRCDNRIEYINGESSNLSNDQYEHYINACTKSLICEIDIRKNSAIPGITLMIFLNRDYKDNFYVIETYFNQAISSLFYQLFFNTPKEVQKTLKAFYQINAVPDFIIDRVCELAGDDFNDFRLNAGLLYQYINEQLHAPTSINSKEIVEVLLYDIAQRLKTINSTVQRQTVCWQTIELLMQKDARPNGIILALCEQINDPTLPFYNSTLAINAKIQFEAQCSNNDIYQCFRNSILTLLKTVELNEPNKAAAAEKFKSSSNLSALINDFINNRNSDNTALDIAKNFKLSQQFLAEDFFESLNMLRLKIAELKSLKQENVQLTQLIGSEKKQLMH